MQAVRYYSALLDQEEKKETGSRLFVLRSIQFSIH